MSPNDVPRAGYVHRLKKLRTASSANRLDGIILVPGPNLRYFTGVKSFLLERPFLLFVPTVGQLTLVSPKLEAGPFLRAPVDMVVHSWDDAEGPRRAIEKAVQELQLRGKWGVEGRAPFQYIHQVTQCAQPQLQNGEPILQGIREVKDKQEVRLLQRAASILAKSYLKLPEILKPGITELQLAEKFSREILANGAESAEDVLVQSGALAADGHHQAGPRKIGRRESIVVDACCTFSGYYADITRTFMIGKDPTFKGLYENVLLAQTAAIDASEKDVTVGSIDGAARTRLEQNGLGKYFVHRTGHGLGLEVHEAPYITPSGDERVQPSMVFTIEPGVYMQSKTGLRIEDDIMITDQGNRVLTRGVPKEFDWWR